MISCASPRVLVLAVGMGTGGAEALIRDSLPLLRDEGFDLSLWVLKEGGAQLESIRQAGHRVRALSDSGGRGAAAPLARLLRDIRGGRFDLIHSHLFWANLCARAAGKWAGVPVVINSHHGTDGWLSLSHRLLERGTVGLADRLVACSEAVRRCAVERLRLPAHKVVTIPNGVPLQRFADRTTRDGMRAALGLDSRSRVIGSVGRLDEPVKGFAVLLEALEMLGRRMPDVVCLICGDGPARAQLENSARKRGLSAQVRFLGERQDIPRVLQALDLYVQPSLSEGFGLSVLEAMASGVPVVATHSGGLPEVVRDGVTGDLVAPGDAALLAQRIHSLLEDPARCAAYGREGEGRA
ncbi:MAG: glycosyltransferase, partial [Acidobacteria bacterium]|nr:glycosyltransferase [Acidobacteriota bacterium]